MTDAQEKVLRELGERGPLTWRRLDALLTAAGVRIGPALFAEVDLLEREGYLVVGQSPHGPKTYGLTPKGVRLASRLAEVARQHGLWLLGLPHTAGVENWEWVASEDAALCDTADPALGPRRAVCAA